MIIDGHSHVTLPIKQHIKDMDDNGVSKTILFSTTFHPEKALNADEVVREMNYLNDLLAGKKGSMLEARIRANGELKDAIDQFPDRYVGFGNVPIGLDMKKTIEYMEKNIYNNGFVGIGELTLGTGMVGRIENIFKAASEFNYLPIWIHAFYPITLQDIYDIAHLAKQNPKIPVIIGHLGGVNWIETLSLIKTIPNLYVDTSAYYSTFVLGAIINEVPEKCLFGVDRPFGDLQISIDTIIKVAKTPFIANAVLGDNLESLLKL